MILCMSGIHVHSSDPCGIAGFGSDKTGAATMLFFKSTSEFVST